MSRIIIIDDEIELAETAKVKLTSEGHEVFVRNTGEGAFELAKRVKPGIAVLDIMLPGTTGYQICRRIRKDPELYKTAILILTALGEEPEILHAIEQGADDHLVKPFKLDRLLEKIAAMEALLAAIEKRNPFTNFPGTEAIKREIDLRLARGVPIAVVYIDMVGFKPYCASRGAQGQKQALEFMAQLLTALPRTLGIYETYVAHMGGAHFVVLLNIEDYERYSHSLIEQFDRNVQQLYAQQELAQGYILAADRHGREAKCPLMVLSIGVAHTQCRKFSSAKRMFEALAQVRQMAQPETHSVAFVDRRHTDR
jgi:CheY-like chemotaxis protein